MVGEPVTATASASNFNPKHTLTYTWASTGGKVTGKDTTATIDTNGVAGGSYTVTARVTDPKMKKGGEASCTRHLHGERTAEESADHVLLGESDIGAGGRAFNLTCTCTSPDNVPVTVSGWTASGGSVSGERRHRHSQHHRSARRPNHGERNLYRFSRSHRFELRAQVTVEVPPPPPPEASKLSECDFPNKVKPWRVDNTCKAILDDVAQRLQHDPDAKLVIVGNAEPGEKRKNLAGERAVNSKAYLSGGEAKQAIDASRIEMRTGSAGTRTAEYWVVPAGATFSAPGTDSGG